MKWWALILLALSSSCYEVSGGCQQIDVRTLCVAPHLDQTTLPKDNTLYLWIVSDTPRQGQLGGVCWEAIAVEDVEGPPGCTVKTILAPRAECGGTAP